MAKRKRYEDYMLLAPGEQVKGRSACYLVERIVGTGAFAAVYAARDPATPGRYVALKEFFPARHPRDQAALQDLFDRERLVGMQASPHPLMPTFYEAFTYDGHFYIAQEFIEGATLEEIIIKRHPLPREWTLKWAVSLCDALAFLHSRQIVHHDLKPANIRITPQGHLTLLDFGAAQYFGEGSEPPTEMFGTEGYLPPELEADGRWVADVRTDIFALGCILYEMIAGVAPDQENINQRSMYVTNSLINQPNADLNMVRLINIALSYNTEYRFASANDFLLEMRKIAPAVLLVSKKHLRFGEVTAGQATQPLMMTLYNAGGGEIRGEIKPRAPWITVNATTFQGKRKDVAVQIAVPRVAERGQLVTGRLEINSADITDEAGTVLSVGDRWFIECSVTVLPSPGYLEMRERRAPNTPPLTLSGAKGSILAGELEIKNYGETPVEYRITAPSAAIRNGVSTPMEGVTVLPFSGTAAPNQTFTVKVAIPTRELPPGNYETSVSVRASTQQTLNIPLTLRIMTPLEILKARFGRRP